MTTMNEPTSRQEWIRVTGGYAVIETHDERICHPTLSDRVALTGPDREIDAEVAKARDIAPLAKPKCNLSPQFSLDE